MSNNLINLDSLKAKSQKVKFLEKEFEVGYIPSGLSIPVVEDFNKNLKEQKETDSQEKIMQDEIKSVSIFCSYYESEFTEEYLSKNATAAQIDSFYKILVTAIYKNFMAAVPQEDNQTGDSLQKKTTGDAS